MSRAAFSYCPPDTKVSQEFSSRPCVRLSLREHGLPAGPAGKYTSGRPARATLPVGDAVRWREQTGVLERPTERQPLRDGVARFSRGENRLRLRASNPRRSFENRHHDSSTLEQA